MGLKPGARGGFGLALACLVGIGVYLISSGVLSGSSSGPALGNACLQPHRPEVARVAPAALGSLREDVVRVLPERIGRLYEEGTVVSANAWNDSLPLPPAVSPTALRPAGYEMRWWAPDGDDVVADAFEFRSAEDARLFLARAGSTHCRLIAHAQSAPIPAQSRNVTWVNPDEASEVDVYVVRGRRVYRIGDVPPGQRGAHVSQRALARALLTVDSLACLLPHASCSRQQRPTVPT
jgi:hypothetical protein